MNDSFDKVSSTKPYLLRALYEWCTDNGLTPFLAVQVDADTTVPMEFVKDGEIVLNISFDATHKLEIGNDWVTFSARFGGVSRDLAIPTGNVMAIYARETGQGMSFPVEREAAPEATAEVEEAPAPVAASVTKLAAVTSSTPDVAEASKEEEIPPSDDEPPRPSGRPSLKVVK